MASIFPLLVNMKTLVSVITFIRCICFSAPMEMNATTKDMMVTTAGMMVTEDVNTTGSSNRTARRKVVILQH